ncbi:hypothetical protein ACEWY4_021804 [Coilia grayii]|uniref:PH domain-containing protein n=1 Tax=Coilia grayii TaxID=363190 RepID=A0ABD1J494_9TELE
MMSWDIHLLKHVLQGSVHHSCQPQLKGSAAMSRRKVSVKDLGQGDCCGWLYKRKDSKVFLRTRWKKYWFVLKRSALYWYTNVEAEKAEGYINLREFTLEQAMELRRKYSMKASHPQVMTLYFAAESIKDMNKWLSAFKEVSSQRNLTKPGEDDGCYSEESDHEESISVEVACQPFEEQLTCSSIKEELPPPRCTSSPFHTPASSFSQLSSESSSQMAVTDQSESWLEITTLGPNVPPILSLPQAEQDGPPQQQQQQCSEKDEMEQLYLYLKQARLSPTGHLQPATKYDYRASFIRRCQDEAINEKLHQVRTLNSTLKSKEADLLCIEQVLADPCLSAYKYRQWREANVLLLQDIYQRNQPPGRRQSPPPHNHTQTSSTTTTTTTTTTTSTSTTTTTPYYAETSV